MILTKSSYAELAAAIPLNGGSQAYLQYAYGPLMSYLFSFTAITALKSSMAAIIANILGEYMTRVFIRVPSEKKFEYHKLAPADLPHFHVKMIACISILLVFLVQAFHPIVGPRVQLSLTVTKLVLLCTIPVVSIIVIISNNMPDASKLAFSSISGLFEGSSTDISRYALALYNGLWAFDGWDQCTFVTGEMRDAARTISSAVLLSTQAVLILFLMTVLSYFAVLPPMIVSHTNSVALDFGASALGSMGGIFFAVLVAFSCLGALNGHLYTYSHLAAAAGQQGFLPACIGTKHKRFGTPLNAHILTTFLTLLFILFGSGFASLINFSGVCAWFWYACTVTCVLVLRVKEPNLERPFRVWLISPMIFLLVALFLLIMPIFSAPWEALCAFLFIMTGIPLYFITRLHSRHDISGILFSSENVAPFERLPTDTRDDIPLSHAAEPRLGWS